MSGIVTGGPTCFYPLTNSNMSVKQSFYPICKQTDLVGVWYI